MTELQVTDRDGVRWIELCRPESRNGLTVEINMQIIAALGDINSREDLRVAVITGGGGNFCSGLDLKYAMMRGAQAGAGTADEVRTAFHGLIRAIRAVDAPVVAAVDGVAVGFGCDLALACDLRIVSDRAKFGELFVKRGLMPDGGGTFTLPRLVGLGRALELMFSGESVSGQDAVAIGMASRVVPADQLTERTWEMARTLAKGPPLVHREIKRAVYASLSGDLDAALERELEGQLRLLASRDFMEGVTAFLQKREPKFEGK